MRGILLRYSKSQVKRAGETPRRLWRPGGFVLTRHHVKEWEWAIDVLDNFRAAHGYALSKATMGLRSRVKTVLREITGSDERTLDISQRLKRHASILAKLAREPTMKLNTMQDIGGCRAVVGTLEHVRAVQRRWDLPKGRVVRVYDYVETPKPSGYRGIHVVVTYDDRPIEVQLRTPAQHEWATTIEAVGGRIGEDLKSGYGPPEVLAFFEVVSEAMAIEEAGETVPPALFERVRARRPAAEAKMRAGS